MNREQWLLLISMILFLALGAYYFRPAGLNFFARGTKPSGAARSDVGESRVEKVPVPSLPVPSVTDQARASAPWGRNPFLTDEESKQTEVERVRLDTVIVGLPKAVAVIDGRTVMVGEKVNEDRVVEIRPDAVVLEREGKKKLLRLDGPSVPIGVKERKK